MRFKVLLGFFLLTPGSFMLTFWGINILASATGLDWRILSGLGVITGLCLVVTQLKKENT